MIGLANSDAISTEYHSSKQMIEQLNHTYKASYWKTNGFDGIEDAGYDLALWTICYNFPQSHKHNHYHILNEMGMLKNADNMP